MELRVRCGESDRAAGSASARGIKEPGPVWVVEVIRTRMPEWAAMWYFSTKAEAEANLESARGRDGNGGVVTRARVTEGEAYWREAGNSGTRRRPRRPVPAYISLEAMGF